MTSSVNRKQAVDALGKTPQWPESAMISAKHYAAEPKAFDKEIEFDRAK